MRYVAIFISSLLIFLTFQTSADADRDILDGLNVRIGINHIASYHTDMDGVVTIGGNTGMFETRAYDPENFAGVSVGTEYMLRIPAQNAFEFGPGVLYNLKQTLERVYENNSMTMTNSYQHEIEEFSNTVVYLAGKYHFPTTSLLQPYILARIGYSFNNFDKYSYTMYEQSTPPVEWGGHNVNLGGEIRDLEDGPFFGIGFGVTLKDHFFIEPVYSYSQLRYRVHLPTGDFTGEERFNADSHNFYLNIGYNFGSHPALEKQAGISDEEKKNLLSGLNVRIGVKDCFPIHATFTHNGFEKFTSSGEHVQSHQTFAYKPENSLIYSVGAEYMYPLSKSFRAGVGIQYNSKNTYYNEVSSPEGGRGDRTFFLSDYSNTVLYGGAKYYFNTLSVVKPYLLGKIGYSFNDFDDSTDTYKVKGETPFMIDKVSMDDGMYVGVGFGLKLIKYVSTEITYNLSRMKVTSYYMDVDRSGNPVYQGDEIEDAKSQSIQLMIVLHDQRI